MAPDAKQGLQVGRLWELWRTSEPTFNVVERFRVCTFGGAKNIKRET
jgi:hypothetical protein